MKHRKITSNLLVNVNRDVFRGVVIEQNIMILTSRVDLLHLHSLLTVNKFCALRNRCASVINCELLTCN